MRYPRCGNAWPASSPCRSSASPSGTGPVSTSASPWWTALSSSPATTRGTALLVSFFCQPANLSTKNPICYAVFMAEEGVECVAEQQADILRCINNSLPHIFSGRRRVSRMHFYVFQQENCRSDSRHQSYKILRTYLQKPNCLPNVFLGYIYLFTNIGTFFIYLFIYYLLSLFITSNS